MMRVIVSILMLGAVAGGLAAAQDASLRYNLAVGDRLIYERRTTVKALDGEQVLARTTEQIQLWCLAQKGDEQLVLVDLIRVEQDGAAPPVGLLLYVDERGRSRLAGSHTYAEEVYPALDLLPVLRLPPRIGPTWRTPADVDLLGHVRTCTLVGPDNQRRGHVRVDFRLERPAEAESVLGRTQGGSYWFDPDRGFVSRVESWQEDRLTSRRTEAVTVLRRGERNDERWARRRAEEAERYKRTQQHEDGLRAKLLREPGAVEETLSRLQRLWAGSATEFDHQAGSPLALLARGRAKRLAAETPALRAAAAYAQRWLNQPAATWSLETVAGQPLSSDDLLGTPVIEFVWSTSDPNVFATLAAVDKLRSAVADPSIRIVCLNVDANVALVRRMQPCLPTGVEHVLAGPLRSVDNPPQLPVLRVLDGAGFIRQIWLGWQPDYADVAARARELMH
ncbi:MAG: hypothetical protein PVJ57_02170 [Phycisphaerae bacterium]|jgi:hypothetical protein